MRLVFLAALFLGTVVTASAQAAPPAAGIRLFRPHAASSSWPGTGESRVLVATPHRPAGHRAFRAQLSRPSSGKSLHRSDFLSLRSPKRGEGYYWGTASPQSSPRPAGERDRVRGRHESGRRTTPTHPARPGLSCHFPSLSRCRTGKVEPTFPGNAPRVRDPARRRPRAVVRE